MHPEPYGHTWNARLPPALTIIGAMRLVYTYTRPVQRFCYPKWIVDYSFSDCGLYRVGSRRGAWRQRLPGEAHLYPPNTPFEEDMNLKPLPIVAACVLFHGGETSGLMCLIDRRKGFGCFLDPQGHLGTLIEQAAKVGQQWGEEGYWQVLSILYEIIALLYRSEPSSAGVRLIPAAEAMDKRSALTHAVETYFREHLAERVLLADVAKHLHVGVSTLAHRYHGETGESPIAALIKMRIHHAKNLFIKGCRLKAVAEDTGFSDEYHLSKMFKHVTGLSPREYIHSISKPPSAETMRRTDTG